MTFNQALLLDLDDIFSLDDEFSQTITYVSSNGVQKDIVVAIFDDEDELIEGTLVNVWCKTSDIPSITKDDTFIWQGDSMDVVDFRADELGHVTKIFLNKEREQ